MLLKVWWLSATVALGCLCVAGDQAASPAAEGSYPTLLPWKPDPAQRDHLRRSLTLLQASTPEKRHTVRVLFYGQSITQQAWWKQVARYLRETYPNANLIIENRAIGGHASQLLVKTAEADLYPFQPDLLVFHVYGSHVEYENLIRRVRERTCADVLLQTDHITRDESLAEETDRAKLSPKQWDAWMNNVFLPDAATRYGACRADVHELWKHYLNAHQLKAAALLRDDVHLNAHGEWLLAEILKPYLAPLPTTAGDPFDDGRVTTTALPASTSGPAVELEFSGTRADVVFQPEAARSIDVSVDGRKPSESPALYGFTRVSAFPNSDWPILLRVSSDSPLRAEDWSLNLDNVSSDGKVCHFSVHGSVTGEDGSAWSTNRFVSKSGRVVIEPDDWNLAYCVSVFKRALPAGHTVTWRAVLHGTDTARPPTVPPGVERGVTVAQGLPPGKHTLRIQGEHLSQLVSAVRFYRPVGK